MAVISCPRRQNLIVSLNEDEARFLSLAPADQVTLGFSRRGMIRVAKEPRRTPVLPTSRFVYCNAVAAPKGSSYQLRICKSVAKLPPAIKIPFRFHEIEVETMFRHEEMGAQFAIWLAVPSVIEFGDASDNAVDDMDAKETVVHLQRIMTRALATGKIRRFALNGTRLAGFVEQEL